MTDFVWKRFYPFCLFCSVMFVLNNKVRVEERNFSKKKNQFVLCRRCWLMLKCIFSGVYVWYNQVVLCFCEERKVKKVDKKVRFQRSFLTQPVHDVRATLLRPCFLASWRRINIKYNVVLTSCVGWGKANPVRVIQTN